MKKNIKITFFALFILLLPVQRLLAQAEFKPWGNLEGMRIKGQLMDFNTRLVIVGKSWSKISPTGKELQKPKYTRGEDGATVVTWIDSFEFTETVKNTGKGTATVIIQCIAHADTSVEGVYFNVSLPHSIYQNARVKTDYLKDEPYNTSALDQDEWTNPKATKKVSFRSPSQQIEIAADTLSGVRFQPDTGAKKFIRYYFPICSGQLHKGNVFVRTYQVKVSGDIDESPARLRLDASVQGRAFAGLGGNFRIQNPKTDPEVIDYCLQNLRVAYGRVEMPWSTWQPDSTVDASVQDSSTLDIRVRRAMQMAQRLSQMHIPVILTAWFPPAWAVVGKLNFVPVHGIWGNPLNKASMPAIYRSITNYIIYLKKYYGVDVTCFSFNESDLGINIRQTGEEHDELIKGLGAYFASKGLQTKMLLGDNSDATTYRFIDQAMNDPGAQPYIGLVSFHSWRGWTTGILQKWADAAKKINKPLIVGEGSIDAAAWGYPDYFQDPSYALEEINLYTRLLAICQPLSILQWQLTADYSPLKGGGLFGNNGPLEPTQRFWNLKQLASTPEGLFYMPITCDRSDISCAALGDKARHIYTIHLVNNGASRKVNLTGLPAGIGKFNVFITNEKTNMKQVSAIEVKDGAADFKIEQRSFVTLVSQ